MAKRTSRGRKPIVVAVSGGFDPLHVGHVRHFHEAKKLGDKLIVILNNDNWLKLKKGFIFMKEKERKEIIKALRSVDEVILTNHKPNTKDISICEELKSVKPHIYAKGGDRTADNIPEFKLAKKLGIKLAFNVGDGGKIQSSSWLLKNHLEQRGASRD